MRSAITVSLLAFVLAAPAHATGSASCRGTINPALQLDIVIGRVDGPTIAQARLSDGGQTIQTGSDGAATIGQSWIDDDAILLEIVEGNGSGLIARLRTHRQNRRGPYSGTLRYGGQTFQVRCRVE